MLRWDRLTVHTRLANARATSKRLRNAGVAVDGELATGEGHFGDCLAERSRIATIKIFFLVEMGKREEERGCWLGKPPSRMMMPLGRNEKCQRKKQIQKAKRYQE